MGSEWVSTAAGVHLKGRRRAGTEPEMILRRLVHGRGLRYRVQRRLAPGCRPDLLFVSARVAVFVDGCFWHGCPQHGQKTFRGPNAERWREKLRRNAERDVRANDLAADAGYAVMRVWECEVRSAATEMADRVEAAVWRGRRLSGAQRSRATPS